MADIFLSYAREDEERASVLAAALAGRGWSVWWDRRIPHGIDFNTFIQQQLDAARCIVVLWSKAALESKFVRDEATEGLNGRVVPVFIEAVKQPLGFRQLQAADLTDWDGQSPHEEWDRLVTSITAIAPPVSGGSAGQSAGGVVGTSEAPTRAALPKASPRRRVVVGATVLCLAAAAVASWKVYSTDAAPASPSSRLSVEELEARLNAANISLSTGSNEDVQRVRGYVRDPETPYRALGEACLEVVGSRRLKERGYLDMIDKWYTRSAGQNYLTSVGMIRIETLKEAFVQAHNEMHGQSARSLDEIVE